MLFTFSTVFTGWFFTGVGEKPSRLLNPSQTKEMSVPRLDGKREAQGKKEKMTWLVMVPRLNACRTCEVPPLTTA